MKSLKSVLVATVAPLAVLAALPAAFAHGADGPQETVRPAFRVPVANVPGKTMTGLLVDYPPGGKSLSHRHGQAFVVAYVLQGEVRSQVDNGEVRVYRAGESWTEPPGAHHTVSENASETEPARLLAIFIADDNATELVIPDAR